MALSDRQMLDALSRTPFVDSTELAGILGEPHATVHRSLTDLLAEGIIGRASHGTAHLASSQRYHLTANGIRETAGFLGFDTPSDFVRAYPVSREWLTLLIRRMDAVASVYRLAASLSPGIDGLLSHVEFHRRGRFDAFITLHDGYSFGVVRQGLALRRRSLYDRLRAIAEYDYSRRPDTVLILVPSVWEQRLTGRFCERIYLRDFFVAVESRDALERRDLRVWQQTTGLFGSTYHTLDHVSSQGSSGGRPSTQSSERKRASIPDPDHMVQAASAFGLSPSEKRTLDIITDHPMIPREHLALWLGVSEGRVSQMIHSLVNTWGLVERQGQRGDTRYTLSAEGIRYITHRDRAQLPTTQDIWSTELTTDKQGRRRHVGHRIETWARQTKHADGITWFLSKLQAEVRADPHSELEWSVPTARTDRTYNWGDSAIAPDAVGQMVTQGLRIPFYLEHELRARHPRGVIDGGPPGREPEDGGPGPAPGAVDGQDEPGRAAAHVQHGRPGVGEDDAGGQVGGEDTGGAGGGRRAGDAGGEPDTAHGGPGGGAEARRRRYGPGAGGCCDRRRGPRPRSVQLEAEASAVGRGEERWMSGSAG